MTATPEDFFKGKAAGYRGALRACCKELLLWEEASRGHLAEALREGLEAEFVRALPDPKVSAEFIAGLHAAEAELAALLKNVGTAER